MVAARRQHSASLTTQFEGGGDEPWHAMTKTVSNILLLPIAVVVAVVVMLFYHYYTITANTTAVRVVIPVVQLPVLPLLLRWHHCGHSP